MNDRRQVRVGVRAAAVLVALVGVAASAQSGCTGSTSLTELQRVKSGALEVVLLSPRGGLNHGKDTFVIEFRSTPGGTLVDVGNVKGSATMPMPGMPMFGSLDIRKTDVAGR